GARRPGARRGLGGASAGDAGHRGERAGGEEEGGVREGRVNLGSIDIGYFAYLASNIPPRELARAVAVRARRALRGGIRQVLGPVARHPALRPPFFMQVPPEQKRRREPRGGRPSRLEPSLLEITARIVHGRVPERRRFKLGAR